MTAPTALTTLLTTAQAAKRLGRHPSRIRQYIRDNLLPATKQGRDWLIASTDVETFTPPDNPGGRPIIHGRRSKRNKAPA